MRRHPDTGTTSRIVRGLGHGLLAASLLVGCRPVDTLPPQRLGLAAPTDANGRPLPLSPRAMAYPGSLPLPSVGSSNAGPPLIVPGREQGFTAHAAAPPYRSGGEGGYVLNFDNADIRDVLRSVLGEMMGLGYGVDPSVQGTISLHTAGPLPRDAVLPALEDALRLAGTALVRNGSGYVATPLQGAAQRGPISFGGGGRRPGFQVELVPLRYVGATEIQHVIEPLVGSGTIVQVDPGRNLLVVAGTGEEIARARDAIALFDVDALRNQSFGLFPLHYSSARDVADDLTALIGKQGAMAGMARITPIEHLNAILVVSARLAAINEMREWIARFDRGHDATKPRLFIYHVQNGRARDLAATLSRVMGVQGAAEPGPADAQPDAQAEPAGLGLDGSGFGPGGAAAGGLTPNPTPGLGAPRAPIPNALLGGLPGGDRPQAAGAGAGNANGLRITADDANNALLIVTTPERYGDLETALMQLDRVPLQVLLEASIAEVSLTKQLQYGVQYFFQNGDVSILRSGAAAGSIAAATGGLSVAFLQGSTIQAVLNLLSSITQVKVVSAPKLMVLNNRTASLQVGDQVPIATASSVSTISANAPVVNSIQLIDTGIILRITPRVNGSGLVLLDLSQEVSASTPTTSSAIDSPTIQQRRVSTSVAVQDGETIAIGGLISDNRTNSRSGVPYLKDIPVLGALFGETSLQATRTELIVLVTPHIIHDQRAAAAASDELRAKLPMIERFDAPHP